LRVKTFVLLKWRGVQRVTDSSNDIGLSDDPQFAAPTANYFMGMYEAH